MKKITKLELLKKIKIILQSDKKISFDTKLKDIEEWDSVATISMIALFVFCMHSETNGNVRKLLSGAKQFTHFL